MVHGTKARRRGAAGGDRRGPLRDGPAPVAGEDPDHPHRPGPGLPRLAHPAPPQTGTDRHYVYTYPAKKALQAIMGKVKTLCRQVGTNQPLDALLRRLNPALRGWCAYFRPGVSSATFAYLSHYLWHTVWGWLRRKHPKTTWKEIRRRYCGARIVVGQRGTGSCSTPRRCAPRATATGAQPSPPPGPPRDEDNHHAALTGLVESPVRCQVARPVREAARGNGPVERPAPRPGPTSPGVPAAD